MLEQMRKSSQSLLIYVLFGILIAVFVISFGPQSRGTSCETVMSGNDHYAAKVAGDLVTQNDFRYGFMVLDAGRLPTQAARQQRVKELVMDKLIERELLAQEARHLGYVVTQDEVEDLIGDGKIIGLGYPLKVPVQKDGKFNYDTFKNYVQFQLGMTPQRFIEEQKKELAASRVRDLLRSSVTVSPEEVKAEFVRKGRQVNLEYVRFAPDRYKSDIAPTDAEIADYAAKNDAKLKASYDEHKFVYENAPKKLHLRQILVKVAEPTSPENEKAAQKKADALRARLDKGEAFAKVAKDASQDDASKARGGDLGWRARGTTNLPTETEEKLFAAKPGDKTGNLVGPVKGPSGFTITKVEGVREGTVPYDQAKLELAESKLREEKAKARAQADAEAAVAKAKAAPTKTLKELYPAAADDKAEASRAEPQAPRAEETGLFAARGTREGILVEGIGPSKELGKAAFGLTSEAPVAGPFEVAGNYVVVRLKERKDPDMAELDKKKLDLLREAELTKWMEVQTDWTHARCVEAKEQKRIQINGEVLRYEDSPEPTPYEPCMGRRMMGG